MLNPDKTLTRDQIQQLYIDWYLEGATLSELQEAVSIQMDDDLGDLTDVELVKEVRFYAPELIKDLTLLIA
jgi:hypothetical protein